MLKFASSTGCGIGSSSDLPVVKPVAKRTKETVLMVVPIQTTLVVPVGVDEGSFV
jgi:hypothetical protein